MCVICFSSPLMSQISLGGIVINEILADPNSSTFNFDTDQDGVFENNDEFVELYNALSSAVDISGFQLYDAAGLKHTFPAGTVIQGMSFLTVVADYTGTPPVLFQVSDNILALNNTGDNIYLYDPVNDVYIEVIYNGGFSGNNNFKGPASAQLLGAEDFGTDTDGLSVQRSPDGSANFVTATPTPSVANVLPVELTRFAAEAADKETVLKWSTATEINNEYFEVQHSVDNHRFTVIDLVEGAGSTDARSDYRYVHTNPAAGKNYYRLRQVDFDGTGSYSSVVSVHFNRAEEDIAIFPNPVAHELNVAADFDFSAEATVEIIAQNGIVFRFEQIGKTSAAALDTSSLPAGFYFLRLVNRNQVFVKRFRKI